MDWYILRHGETVSTVNGEIGYGDKQLTTGIIPEGIPAIEKMAEYLKQINPDHAAASELLRVQQTVSIIEEITNVTFHKDARLNEMLNENNQEPDYPYTGYFEAKRSMVSEFINEMKIKKYNTIFVATHGIVISALKHLLSSGKFEVENIGDYPKTGIITLIKGNTTEEIDFN